MARKKSILGTLATLGGLAAAAAVAYKRREELMQLFSSLTTPCASDGQETEAVEEPEIIIHATGTVKEEEETPAD